MLRGTFERQLSRLEEEVLVLGSLVSQALDEAVRALRERDLETARRLIAGDRTQPGARCRPRDQYL
jgi:phosphate uptake regulator